MTRRPVLHDDPGPIADAILEHAGGRVVLGLPLGLGKAPAIANALFERAAADASISLRIFTALTLEPPRAKGDLEQRFLGPLNQRLFAGYPRFAYAEALREARLPPNVEVNEFFFQAGNWLAVDEAQRSYISANYTHAAGYLRDQGVNAIAQLVASRGEGADRRLSLSCNTDLTLDLADLFRARGGPCLMVGQINAELPFMGREAALPAAEFDHLLDGHDFPLFAPPNPPVSNADHAIGLRAAALVPDGGTIQIGIGSIGDAFGAALLMRHREPELFRETLERLGPSPFGPSAPPETGPFETGLYAVSEMVVPSLLELYDGGVLRRRARDEAALHGGFFVGPRGFYRRLREMPEDERDLFAMRGISFVNELYGEEEAKRADRAQARFVNNAMMATLLGSVVSDTLEDGRVVSGVGGQYNFVAQAFALDGARAVMTLNATRTQNGRPASNIRWSYGATTIPRHLRDIVVTEHGVADLRGRTDARCIAAMLSVAAPEFRAELAEAASAKRREDRVDGAELDLGRALGPARQAGWCRAFPFGTDFTAVEQRLLPALGRLKQATATRVGLARSLAAAARTDGEADREEAEALARLGLDRGGGLRASATRRLVLWALRHEAGQEGTA